MNRYKPRGWRYESHRHSLAARGVGSKQESNKYFMTFMNSPRNKDGKKDAAGSWTGLSDHSQGIPGTRDSAFRKWDVEIVKMSPSEFLDITRKAAEVGEGGKISKEDFEKSARVEYELGRINDNGASMRIERGLRSEDDVVPLVFYEVDANGNLLDTQEGRKRAIVAEKMGMKEIPVAKYTKRTDVQKEEEAENSKEYQASKDNMLFGTTKDEQAMPFIKRNIMAETQGDGLQQFKEDVAEMARHPFKDMDGEWEEYTSLAENEHYGKYGKPEPLSNDKILRAQQRAAATFGRVATQANVEPLVDKRECDRSMRDVTVDFLFGRRVR